MAFCVYCGKCFTRKEHLERHLVSHTNITPHRCLSCHLPFSRRLDLLKRHCAAYHGQTLTDSIEATSTVKARTAIACKSCAKAKTGCDKKVPCSRCVTKQIQCEPRYLRRGMGGNKNQQPTTPPKDGDNTNNNSSNESGSPKESAPDTLKEAEVFDSTEFFGSSPTKNESSVQEQMEISFVEPLQKFSNDFQGDINILDAEAQISEFTSWNDFAFDQEMYSTDNILPGNDLDSYNLSDQMETIKTPASNLVTPALTICTSPSINKTSFLQEVSPNQARLSINNANFIDRWSPHDFQVIIAAEDAWPIACCNAQIFSGVCPRTASFHLKSLQQVCDNENVWTSFDTSFSQMDANDVEIVPLSPGTREKIVAITQSFLHKVLATQMGELHGRSGQSEPSRFLILPPPNILESFISNYSRNLAVYFSLLPGGRLNINELMVDSQSSTLLVILMIAQGSTSVSSAEAKYLAMGLTEICRLSLFEAIDRNTGLSADFVMLHCAFLFVLLGAWGGDKWHMNVAVGHTPMLILMLKYAGMLEPQRFMISFSSAPGLELDWRAWQEYESRNRLVYNWVSVDQELSLFHDTYPILATMDIETPLPDSEHLWVANNADDWFKAFTESHSYDMDHVASASLSTRPLPSLHALFQLFSSGNLAYQQVQPSPLYLKLLLHPLHALTCHLRHALACDAEVARLGRESRAISRAITLMKIEELESLLQKWYDLNAAQEHSDPSNPVTQGNYILFHLISLNTVTSMPEIEKFARSGPFDELSGEFMLRYNKCVYQTTEALYHAGQVLRVLQIMPKISRPPWWPAALYRATIILWIESMRRSRDVSALHGRIGPLRAINSSFPNQHQGKGHSWNVDEVLVLSRSDGTNTFLDSPKEVLGHCVGFLDDPLATGIANGIRRKLETLARNWHGEI
ncbi:uncharacterized protein LY89DRAFT_573888 [Mollisia scopiformis]|uniref:Uncharacterized protein n=1 Tax=Mollisia scopiformis TaxID=149040 RepID=A0A194XT45_MOLSC|nr:uncharacterized protein LY89DRAFT_573888 [Mollisia scopiformis]KUJ23219.1 hypothetical protein LY89DRAFT_573888 [Mollisia scopiformis]